MARICAICGKGAQYGNKITRRGMAKIKGGAGQKITGITKRKFEVNLQRIRIILEGKRQKALVCSRCIKGGKAKKV